MAPRTETGSEKKEDKHEPSDSRESSSSGDKEDGKKPDSENKGEPAEKNDKEEGGEEKKPHPPSKKVIVIAAIVLLVLLVIGFLYWLHARNFVSTDDAYTTSHIHQISSRVSGTVIDVPVDDNQHVRKGDVIVRLDPRDYDVALQKAQAGLAQAVAQAGKQEAVIEQMKAQVAVADAQVLQSRAQGRQADAQLEKARLDYERITSLYTKDMKAVSKADVDATTASFTSAKSSSESVIAGLSSSEAQAVAARANLQAAEAERDVDKANVAAGEASVHDAELQLSYCSVIAPEDGKVSKKTVETGQRLQPGQQLMAIVPDDVWILANLKETQLERVQVGQRVDIKIDTLPHYKFFGSVNSIQAGSGATFSLLPPDNATGNFTKIVQRVPVKIVFDENSIRDFKDKIVAGLSVEPTIDLQSLQNNKREPKRQNEEDSQNRKREEGK